MGNNNLKNTNDILIKVDQNNLIYIDPNTVMADGRPQSRGVEPENLTMYVNLEADLIPRTTLIADGDKNSLTSIAGGTLNFLKNQDGRDYDTRWTDAYTEIVKEGGEFVSTTTNGRGSDKTAQSFGIDSISIKIEGVNFIPQVQIRFIDVRGKTLFESPEESPYGAFFHLPWPIFYLTIKGFYGKAIKFRLHMVKFNTRFNPTNGNMEVDTTFVGSTYAYLADIPYEGILNAPYFYLSETDLEGKLNEKTGMREVSVSKTTKGYRILNSVYQEYKAKGLIPEDFPVRTLREIIIIAGRLSKELEQEIFKTVIDPKILAGVKEFESIMSTFEGGVEAWKSKNVSPEYFTNGERRPGSTEEIRWFKLTGDDRNTLNKIVDPKKEGTLERLIHTAVSQLEENVTFGKKRNEKLIKNEKLSISPISFTMLKNIQDFYTQDVTVGVDMDGVMDAIYTVFRNFIEQRNKLESDIEEHMNEIVKDRTKGIGFEPTIRNIIGVVLANADTYVRLMKDVHTKAFENAEVRRKILAGVQTDSDKPDQCIYPWPEIKVSTAGGRELVLKYPGSRELIGKLQSDNPDIWPEVEFVENFYEIATKKLDPLTGKEGASDNIEFIFDTQSYNDKIDISVLTNMMGTLPYGDKSFSSVLYEIFERARYTTAYSPFSGEVMKELANAEFENLKKHLEEDIDVIDFLQQNIKSYANLLSFMQALSTYERYPYYVDQLPTIWYIKQGIEQDFRVSKYVKNKEITNNNDERFTKLSNFLLNYKAEDYRLNIYPFNTTMYSGYTGHDFTQRDLGVGRMLEINTPFDFIKSPIDPKMWVKEGYTDNMFNYVANIGGIGKHILNTPYFHKQLYSDFTKPQPREKYVGSAYLLLNSLPFKDLDDTIETTLNGYKYGPTLMSTLFREIGASHYIPYHLMLKWGALYHRYKKYINGDGDILDLTDQKYDEISSELFYSGTTWDGVSYYNGAGNQEIGLHPFYEAVYHQIVNGYSHFSPISGDTYQGTITSGITYLYSGLTDNKHVYSSFVDETKFGYTGYTLLPTNGYNNTYGGTGYTKSIQENFRVLWNVGVSNKSTVINYNEYDFPRPEDYLKQSNGNFKLSGATDTNFEFQKVVDLIATFKPDILDVFERAFLDFASEKLDEEVSYSPYNVLYPKFQDILKAISLVRKDNLNPITDRTTLIKTVKESQTTGLRILSGLLLSPDNLVKIDLANPREIDTYVLGGFTGVDVANFSVDSYPGSLTAQMEADIKLYLGEDVDGYYENFFDVMNINPSEENIKQFRMIAYVYAGLRAAGISHNKVNFVDYLKTNIISPNYTNQRSGVNGMNTRLSVFLNQLIGQISKLEIVTDGNRTTKQRGYNDDPIKLELYNFFKSFNDKWTAGNSIGQRTLMEEFLFLDKANKDIGDELYIDMQRLMRLKDPQNSKINLFSVISLLTQDSGIDIRALPSYVNFYGTNYTNSQKTKPSKNVAQSMFGTFLEVDYEDSAPKIILQYTGPTSKHPELADINKKYKYKNDGFDISDVNNNPIIVAPDVFRNTDFSKSNKVVAFEVSFGDQNQSIFKGVELDQATLRNTSESFEVLERLGRNETGSSTSQIDIGLFNIYRQSSYQCKVTAMGNMMIQPTMYFYVKNIPLFRGSYLITEVTHDIGQNGAETTFKGTRIPQESLPNPEDSFLASYRPLFDRLTKNAKAMVETATRTTESGTSRVITTSQGSYRTDPITEFFPGEKFIKRAGMTDYGIPYNGGAEDGHIQLIRYEKTPLPVVDDQWLRAIAITMGGPNYKIDDGKAMNIISNLSSADTGTPRVVTWGEIKDIPNLMVYSSRFFLNASTPYKYVTPDIVQNTYNWTEFLNPRLVESRSKYLGVISIEHRTNFTDGALAFEGPVSVGPAVDGFGIGLSKYLMTRLGLQDGNTIYFRLIQ